MMRPLRRYTARGHKLRFLCSRWIARFASSGGFGNPPRALALAKTQFVTAPSIEHMSEAEVIARTQTPATVRSLASDLSALGVQPGMTLLAHSAWNDENFPRIGEAFAHETGLERRGQVALAEARLMPQHALVDYAVTWMEQHRPDRS